MVPCVAPGFCGSFGSCVPGGSWLRGFLAFWLLAACLLASLVHGSSGSSGPFFPMAPSAPVAFRSYGSFGSTSTPTSMSISISQSINQSIFLSIYLFVFLCILPYLTLSYPILPYLFLSYPVLSYLFLFILSFLYCEWMYHDHVTLCKGEAPRPVFFYLNPTWVLHEYWAYLYTLSRLTRGIE